LLRLSPVVLSSHLSWRRRPSTNTGPAFGEVFGNDLGLLAKAVNVHESDFLFFLTVGAFETAVDGDG